MEFLEAFDKAVNDPSTPMIDVPPEQIREAEELEELAGGITFFTGFETHQEKVAYLKARRGADRAN